MGSRKKPAAAAPAVVEVAAPAIPIVLFYTGEGPIFGDAPARDLTAADLAYLHRIKALRASGGQPVKPATTADLDAIAAELASSGAFSQEAPTAPAEPAEGND